MPAGIFISFEGGEGCGKSTQIELLQKRLRSGADSLQNLLVVREPGGTPLGEEIRRLLKHTAPDWRVCAEAELLLFAASRAQLVRDAIEPALTRGATVICDRFLDSTVVYQGAARHLPPKMIETLNQFVAGDRRPDLTLLLDLPADAALQRASRRDRPLHLPPDRLEQEPAAFYQDVRAAYLALAKQHPDRFVVLDASLPIDELADRVWSVITARFHGLCSPART